MEDPIELVIVIDSVSYTYHANDGSARAKELKRVAKLLTNTRQRLDAKLEAIRLAETA